MSDRIEGILVVADVPDSEGNVWTEEAIKQVADAWVAHYSVPAGRSGLTMLPGSLTVEELHASVALGVHLDSDPPSSALLGVSSDLELKRQQLEAVKAEALALQGTIERAQWGVIDLLDRIRDQDLYRAAWNDQEGRFFRSFSEYLPALLAEWYTAGLISTDSVRQIRTYLRAKRLFLNPANGFGLTGDDLVDLGITHFERLAEALDYDKETGVVADPPAPGKIGLGEALEVLDQIRAGGQTVQETRETLDALRGLVRKGYSLTVEQRGVDTFVLRELLFWEDGAGTSAQSGMSGAQVERLCKSLGVKAPRIIGG